MAEERVTRRKFMGDSAKLAAGVAGCLGATAGRSARAAGPPAVDTSKILNYNPNMEYRRQGKTGLMVSAVCLGGHSRSNQQERTEIISRCIDLGINYVDSCTFGLEALDETLQASKQEYTDLWRITCYEPGGRHTFNTSCEIIEALEKAKKQGKARFVGFSSHDRRWIQFMIEYFPQVEVVCFPFTTMTKTAPTDSLFDALKKRDVGAFGIKPFGAGSLFMGSQEEKDRLGRLAIRYILHSNTVIPIPGMNALHHVENVVKAVTERRELDRKEQAELDGVSRQMWANLPPNYQWLRDWEYV